MVARSPRVSAAAPSPKNSSQAPTTFCLRRYSVSAHHIGRRDARLQLAGQLNTDDFRQAHPRSAAEHHALGFKTTHTNGDNAQGINVRGMAVGADAGIRECHTVTHLDHWRHFLQVDLVHDAVARRNDVDVFESFFGPLNKVEAVFVATVLNRAVLFKRLGIVTVTLHRQRVVDNQLGWNHRVHLRRITALQGNGVAQTGEIDQRGLPENVMAHHTRRKPGKVEVALALD